MSTKARIIHPYIPNSVPEVQMEMLKEIGVSNIDELYGDIPEILRFKGEMDIPKPVLSEYELKRHVEKILSKNISSHDYTSFLGSGCYQHFVPATCDEINQKSEFLTAYAGEPYEDHGRFQTLFEYVSMMAELLDCDVVNVPTYDGSQAASTSLRMAGRITKRSEILITSCISPDKLAIIKNYCSPLLTIKQYECNTATGKINLDDLKLKINSNTTAIYFENPTFLGVIEDQGEEISRIAHDNGALCVVSVDPISLGVLLPPSNYGADIVCGDIQTLGVHQHYGGGMAGFIATKDDEKFVREYPSRLFGITKTNTEGEYGFGDVLYDERTSFGAREKGKEFVGTAAALWGITAGVYLATLGPKGMTELGQTIMQKSQYACKKISSINGVKVRFEASSFFKEFVVDFSGTGKKVKDLNQFLLSKKMFGGHDLSGVINGFDNCALYCITEVHSESEIDNLVEAIKEFVQ